MSKQIEQWSYSRYNDYATCPAKAKYKHIDKIKEPANPAMERGSLIHKEAEIYVEAQQDRMPTSLTKCQDYFDELADADLVFTERKMAMTRDWRITDFFAKDCWVRMILDLMFKIDDTLVIVDYKTGRQRPEHRNQLSLYAIAGFAEFGDDIKEVDAEIWYLDHGERMDDTYTREDIPWVMRKWEEDTTPMLSDVRFAPRPGHYCRWCHFRKDNGGPCEF